MDALVGKPLKAFLNQDHDAHITTHTSFMQDPMVAQLVGQNPQAQKIMASLQAHIAEHLGFKYRKQMEEKLGVALPPPNEELPENIEVELSQLLAKAGTQLTQTHQKEAAQQKAQQQAQDPVLQLQQQELQIKAQEVQRKTAKDQLDATVKQQELQRKAQKDMVDSVVESEKLALERKELEMDAEKEGVKFAADRRRDRTKLDLELAKMASSMAKPRNTKDT